MGVEPEGMGVSPDGKIVVNTSETTNMAHMIDTETYEIVANVLVDTRPRFAEYNRDGKLLFVSAEIGGTVWVIDTGDERDRPQDRPSRCRACCPRRCSRSASGSPRMARRPTSRSGRRTGWRWSMPRPSR